MNPLVRIPYITAGALARRLSRIAPAGGSKVARAFHARRGILHRYAEWASHNRDPLRPLLWVHAPSVGEGLQASPVIELFRLRHPEAQLAYTFFSPSAETFAAGTGADFYDYLPFDSAHDSVRVIESLNPTAIVFSKLDVWPLLVESAALRRIKLGMISATLPSSSRRRSTIARLALRDAYKALDRVGAISDEDAGRLIEAGVRPDRINVTGDTRYDQAWARAKSDSMERRELVNSLKTSRFTVVAGSTWPSDEERLLPAWLAIRSAYPEVRLLIAPHE
jgi:3-deoxy-D-manno-octulosonic-acid transferase